MQAYFSRVQTAIEELRLGKMIILTDHPDREDEGDIIFPAEIITPTIVNFMIRHCSGIICLSLTGDKMLELGLSDMVSPHENTSHRGTPFTVSIEARTGITTGVSAHDRSHTIFTAAKTHSKTSDLVKPGHIFPLHARDGGVLERQGHTEGSIDIVRLAGFSPSAVLCEVMNPDGTMSRGRALKAFAKEHSIVMLSIEDIIHYRRHQENLITEEVETKIPLKKYGEFTLSVAKEKFTTHEHIILSKPAKQNIPLVRIHSSCITGDLFASERCDCHMQFEYSLQQISEQGGMLIYLAQEGRGIGLFNKIKAYSLQDDGCDTVVANQRLGLPVDSREYYIAANILKNRNIQQIKLLTNNPLKVSSLKKYGIENITRVPIPIFCNSHNQYYLETKKNKLHHHIPANFTEGLLS